MLVKVRQASKKATEEYSEITMDDAATLGDLKLAFEKAGRLSRHRQAFRLVAADGKLVALNDDKKTLASYGVNSGMELQVENVGRPINLVTQFLLEYHGPLLLMLFYASRPAFVYGADASSKPMNDTARFGVIAWVGHFLKREIEFLFVHCISNRTHNTSTLVKKCAYFWSFGAVVGYSLCHPDYQCPVSDLQVLLGLLLFVVSELLGFVSTLQNEMRALLRSLERAAPTGPLFALVSCPYYTLEVLAWVGFSIFTQLPFAYIFTAIGFVQMTDWAVKKHTTHITTYGDAYRQLGRKAIVPFVI